jgi:hypothetical protein
MPIGSMIKHFRAEFEDYIEQARADAGLGAPSDAAPHEGVTSEEAGPYATVSL